MKTLFDLIQEWRSMRADAERLEVQARKTRQEANALETQVRDALLQHGPVVAASELFLPPGSPNDPIRVQRVNDAICVVLPQSETINPKGGAV